MKEKILEAIKKTAMPVYQGQLPHNIYGDLYDPKKLEKLISQALDEYAADKYEKGYLDGKNNQPKGLNK